MKYKSAFLLSMFCFLTAFLLLLALGRSRDEALAGRLAPQVLRFHILANSDSSHDQQLKLETRDAVLSYIQGQLDPQAGKTETAAWIEEHQAEILDYIHHFLADRAADTDVSLEVTQDYFPTRAYGEMVFPCGTYDALRITLGEGKGHNWWCVLYPPLCYTDSMQAILPEDSMETLKALVSEADYRDLTRQKPVVHVRFRLLELF